MRPCNLCPHMKRITLAKIRHALETLQHEVDRRPRRSPARARRAVERMLAVGAQRRGRVTAARTASTCGRAPTRSSVGTGRRPASPPRSALAPAPVRARHQGRARRGGSTPLGAGRRSPRRSAPTTRRPCTPPTRWPCRRRPRRAGGGGAARRATALARSRAGCAHRRALRPRGRRARSRSAARRRTAARRIVHAGGDATGAEIARALGRRGARRSPRSTSSSTAHAVDLLAVEDGRVVGVARAQADGRRVVHVAPRGRARHRRHRPGLCAAPPTRREATGDGLAMAARGRRRARRPRVRAVPPDRAGAPARRPAAAADRGAARRGRDPGRRGRGERFMADAAPRPPSSRRATSSRARDLRRSSAAGRPVFLDARAAVGAALPGALPDRLRGLPTRPASTRAPSRCRCRRRRTTTWAASRWTPRAGRRLPGLWAVRRGRLDRRARRQPPRLATRCSRRSSSARAVAESAGRRRDAGAGARRPRARAAAATSTGRRGAAARAAVRDLAVAATSGVVRDATGLRARARRLRRAGDRARPAGARARRATCVDGRRLVAAAAALRAREPRRALPRRLPAPDGPGRLAPDGDARRSPTTRSPSASSRAADLEVSALAVASR